MNERDRRRVESLKLKTIANGASPEEEASAKRLIKNIMSNYPNNDNDFEEQMQRIRWAYQKMNKKTKTCIHCNSTNIKPFSNPYGIHIIDMQYYFCEDCLNETVYYSEGMRISSPHTINLTRLKMHMPESEIMAIYFSEKEKLKPIIKRSSLKSKIKLYAIVFIYKLFMWKW